VAFMMNRYYPGMGLFALACVWPPMHLFGQSQIDLQPLLPAPSNQSYVTGQTNGVPATITPVPLLDGNKPITLESFPKADGPTQSSAEAKNESKSLSVKPLPLAGQDTKANKNSKSPKKPQLNVDEMIGTPVTATNVLSRVNTSKGLELGGSLGPDIRNQNPESANYYDWTAKGLLWESPAFCHSPLYFEQPNLERYGNGRLASPAWSTTYFFGQVVAWPITSIYQLPWTKQCTLGNHRPGDCAPFQRRQYRPHTLAVNSNVTSYQVSSYVSTEDTAPTSVVALGSETQSMTPSPASPFAAIPTTLHDEAVIPPVVYSNNWKQLPTPPESNVPQLGDHQPAKSPTSRHLGDR
jgi:hypothetical protein